MALTVLGEEGVALGNAGLNERDLWRSLERVRDGREQTWQQTMSDIGNCVGKSWEEIYRRLDDTRSNQRLLAGSETGV